MVIRMLWFGGWDAYLLKDWLESRGRWIIKECKFNGLSATEVEWFEWRNCAVTIKKYRTLFFWEKVGEWSCFNFHSLLLLENCIQCSSNEPSYANRIDVAIFNGVLGHSEWWTTHGGHEGTTYLYMSSMYLLRCIRYHWESLIPDRSWMWTGWSIAQWVYELLLRWSRQSVV